mmetsp:Transcript_10286/g.14980  ORF Transcript_10286/g.14980 Transcript_10286/m.14980 type:complete len:92 (+) Transcript_10286:152-427(+)
MINSCNSANGTYGSLPPASLPKIEIGEELEAEVSPPSQEEPTFKTPISLLLLGAVVIVVICSINAVFIGLPAVNSSSPSSTTTTTTRSAYA